MRRRLVIAISGVAVLAVLLLAIPLAVVLSRTYRDEGLLRLQRDTVASTRGIDVGAHGDPVELPHARDRLAVYDRAGRRIAGQGPARADDLVRTALRTGRPADDGPGGELLVAVPLLDNERITGAVRAVRDEGGTLTDVHQAWLLLAALGAAIVLLAVVAARLLAGRLARPLERVAAAASRLGHGDFSIRAPRSQIGEVDAVASALDATAERLGALIARERAFTADASHQLRTPLSALRLELEALELAGDARPELAAAVAQTDRLQATIETLLAVARDVPRNREPVALEPVLDDLERAWRGELAATGRPLQLSAPAEPVVIAASPPVVREILDILLDNAFRHGAGPVTIGVRAMGAYVGIEVSDRGAGFSIADDAAFARRGGDGSGHGIGLALARSLAEAEGGRLDIPDAGPGPTVRLLIPAAGESAGPPTTSPASITPA